MALQLALQLKERTVELQHLSEMIDLLGDIGASA